MQGQISAQAGAKVGGLSTEQQMIVLKTEKLQRSNFCFETKMRKYTEGISATGSNWERFIIGGTPQERQVLASSAVFKSYARAAELNEAYARNFASDAEKTLAAEDWARVNARSIKAQGSKDYGSFADVWRAELSVDREKHQTSTCFTHQVISQCGRIYPPKKCYTTETRVQDSLLHSLYQKNYDYGALGLGALKLVGVLVGIAVAWNFLRGLFSPKKRPAPKAPHPTPSISQLNEKNSFEPESKKPKVHLGGAPTFAVTPPTIAEPPPRPPSAQQIEELNNLAASPWGKKLLDGRTRHIYRSLLAKPKVFGKHEGHTFSLLPWQVNSDAEAIQRLRELINIFGNPITESIRRLILLDAGCAFDSGDDRLYVDLPRELKNIIISGPMEFGTKVMLEVDKAYLDDAVISIKKQIHDELNELLRRFMPPEIRADTASKNAALFTHNLKYYLIGIPNRWETPENDLQMVKYLIGANEGNTRDQATVNKYLAGIANQRKSIEQECGASPERKVVPVALEEGIFGIQLALNAESLPAGLLGLFKPELPPPYAPIPIEMSLKASSTEGGINTLEDAFKSMGVLPETIESSGEPKILRGDDATRSEIRIELGLKGINPTPELVEQILKKKKEQDKRV